MSRKSILVVYDKKSQRTRFYFRIIKLFVCCLIWTFSFTISTIAQTDKTQFANSSKVGLIFTERFEDEETGIKEIIEVNKKLRSEFKTRTDKLNEISTEIQKKVKEVKNYENDYVEKGCKLVNCAAIMREMIADIESVTCKFINEQKIVKTDLEKRKSELLIEVKKRIFASVLKFAKEKDFALILDGAELDKSSPLIETPEFVDITEEFINFYNQDFVE